MLQAVKNYLIQFYASLIIVSPLIMMLFPIYYLCLGFFYFAVFIFDEGLMSLLRWEENRYAKITTQTFDSILHLYYYFFYAISLFFGFLFFLRSGIKKYLATIVKTPDPNKEPEEGGPVINNDVYIHSIPYIIMNCFLVFGINILNIYGNYWIREYYPHTLAIEAFFLLLSLIYYKLIHWVEPGLFMIPMSYGVLKSIFWSYILIFQSNKFFD